MSFSKDQRVFVCGGEYSRESGKVIEDDFDMLQRKYKVKLDRSGNLVSIKESDLEHEELKSHEIAAEIKNLTGYVPEAPGLSGNMRQELPNHLEMLEKALNSGNKSESLSEYNYINSYLKVPDEGMRDKRISLEKLGWAVKRM